MEKITFGNQFVTVGGKLRLPVPEGYHYASEGKGGNRDWLYMVPETVSLDDDHVDAAPYSFAVTVSPVSKLPFEAHRMQVYEKVFLTQGILNPSNRVESLVNSAHCGWLYQFWSDSSNPTYNKINGFVMVGDMVHQFHFYANYDAPIALETDTIYHALSVALEWMGKAELTGDSGFAPDVMQTRKQNVCDDIADFCRLVEDNRSLLGVAMDFPKALREHFIAVAVFLCRTYKRPVDVKLCALLTELVGGPKLTTAAVFDLLADALNEHPSVESFLQSYASQTVIRLAVQVDKLAGQDYMEGLTRIYYETMDKFLQVLCGELGIRFSDSSFYRSCVILLRRLIGDIWDTDEIMVFQAPLPDPEDILLEEDSTAAPAESLEDLFMDFAYMVAESVGAAEDDGQETAEELVLARKERELRRREEEEAENIRLEQERLRREAEEAERRRQEEEQQRREAEEARRRRREEERRRREEERADRRRRDEERLREANRRMQEGEEDRNSQTDLTIRRNRYDDLTCSIEVQEQIIAANRGLFGSKAAVRKDAQRKLEALLIKRKKEFPFGRP